MPISNEHRLLQEGSVGCKFYGILPPQSGTTCPFHNLARVLADFAKDLV